MFFVSIFFSYSLILVISCLLLAFEFFWSSSSSSFNFDDRVSILDLSALLWWAFIVMNFPLDTALRFPRDSGKLCLHSGWFQRTSLFLPSFRCLSSQHSEASCSVSRCLCRFECVSWSWVLLWLFCGLIDCYDFCSFAFAKEWFASNDVVNCRVCAMWCWEKCLFCGFGVEHSVYVY